MGCCGTSDETDARERLLPCAQFAPELPELPGRRATAPLVETFTFQSLRTTSTSIRQPSSSELCPLNVGVLHSDGFMPLRRADFGYIVAQKYAFVSKDDRYSHRWRRHRRPAAEPTLFSAFSSLRASGVRTLWNRRRMAKRRACSVGEHRPWPDHL